MKKKTQLKSNLLLTLVASLFCFVTWSQTSEQVRSDRPGLSNSPYSVGKNQLQLQAGYQVDFFQLILSDVAGQITSSFSNRHSSALVARYGITERFEVNAFSSYFFNTQSSISNSLGFSGISLRGNLYSGDGIITAIGGQADVSFLSRDLGAIDLNAVNTGVRFSGQSVINETFTFTTNLGFFNVRTNNVLLPVNDQQTYYYTLNLGAGFGKWSCFAEYQGSYSNAYSSAVDVGAAYLCGNNLQFDLYAGMFEIDSPGPNPFISAGVTYRLNCAKAD